MSKFKLITDGLVKNNPTFVLLLGMCPTLATTTSAINGLSMGLATLFVLVLSNMAISLIAPVVLIIRTKYKHLLQKKLAR